MLASLLLVFGCAAVRPETATVAFPSPSAHRRADLAQRFPRFHIQRSLLTTAALVVDVAQFHPGHEAASPSWSGIEISIAQSRELAERFERTYGDKLVEKGYRVKPLPVLGVGFGADEDYRCLVLDRVRGAPTTLLPPYDLEQRLSHSEDAIVAWQSVLRRVREISRQGTGDSLVPGISGLRDLLGAEYAFVAVGLSKDRPHEEPPLTYDTPHHRPPPLGPYSGSELCVALLDCRDGRVLWADVARDILTFSPERMDRYAENLVAVMP